MEVLPALDPTHGPVIRWSLAVWTAGVSQSVLGPGPPLGLELSSLAKKKKTNYFKSSRYNILQNIDVVKVNVE